MQLLKKKKKTILKFHFAVFSQKRNFIFSNLGVSLDLDFKAQLFSRSVFYFLTAPPPGNEKSEIIYVNIPSTQSLRVAFQGQGYGYGSTKQIQ